MIKNRHAAVFQARWTGFSLLALHFVRDCAFKTLGFESVPDFVGTHSDTGGRPRSLPTPPLVQIPTVQMFYTAPDFVSTRERCKSICAADGI
jgi:hypothetical protein